MRSSTDIGRAPLKWVPRGMPGSKLRLEERQSGSSRKVVLRMRSGRVGRPRSEMLRRKPTRLELKLDDIEEFEGARKELESRKKQREDVDGVGASDCEGALGLNSDHKSREQMIHDRIGYKPQPKPNNRSSQFGNFEF